MGIETTRGRRDDKDAFTGITSLGQRQDTTIERKLWVAVKRTLGAPLIWMSSLDAAIGLYRICLIRPHTLRFGPRAAGMSSKIPIRLQGLHTGLQLHALHASPVRSSHQHQALIRTAVGVRRPPIYELVMSRPISVPAPVGYSSRATLIS